MPRMESTNLEVFLRAATPRLPWRSASMDCFQGGPSSVWQLDSEKNGDAVAVEYFALADLWEHYAESSAYGLPVPVRGLGGTVVTQHLVPYLSAVQIYTTSRPNSSLGVSRSTGSETDSWSNDSGAGERSSWDAASDDDDDDDSAFKDVVSSKQRGYLNFQYTEWDSPYDRVPLSQKVAELAQELTSQFDAGFNKNLCVPNRHKHERTVGPPLYHGFKTSAPGMVGWYLCPSYSLIHCTVGTLSKSPNISCYLFSQNSQCLHTLAKFLFLF